MKFIKLEIKNIASIGEAVIDFNASPLKNESLFLICGATGSGKSTILDAICLALYGTAPRLEGYGNESYEDKELNVAGNEECVRIGNPCQLVRRNTGEAYARLYFTGNNNKHYTATWSAVRGMKKRLDVKLKTESSLYCMEDDMSVNKRVAEEVARPEIVGLKFEEFCRTTLLAQGGFTKFLNSKSSEKSDILEKLTGTEIYSEIGRTIYRIYSNKNRCYEEKRDSIAAYKLMSDEEREEKKGLIDIANKEIETLKKESNDIDIKINWLKNYIDSSHSLEKEKVKLDAAIKKMDAPEISTLKKIVLEWNETENVRRHFLLYRNLLPEREKNKMEETELNKAYAKAVADEMVLQNMIYESEKALSVLSKQLESVRNEIPMYENSEVIIAGMQELIRKYEELKNNEYELKKISDTLPVLNAEIKTLSEERQILEKNLLEKNREYKDIEENLKSLPSLSCINKRKTDVEKIYAILKDIQSLSERNFGLENRYTDVANRLKLLQKEFSELEKEKKKAEIAYEEKNKLYENMRLRMDNHAKALRSKLKTGDICPVCGEVIKELLHDEDISELLYPIEQQRIEVAKLLEQNIKTYNETTASIKSYELLGEDILKQLLSGRKEEKEKKNELNALFSEKKVLNRNEKMFLDNDIIKWLELENSEILLLQQKRDKLGTIAVKTANEIVDCRKTLSSVMEKYAVAVSRKKQSEESCDLLLKQAGICKNAIYTLRENVAKNITIDSWEDDLSESINELRTRRDSYFNAKTKTETLASRIKELSEIKRRIDIYRKKTETFYPQWNGYISSQTGDFNENPEKEWIEISNRCVVLKNNIEHNEKDILLCEKVLKDFFTDNPSMTHERIAALCNYTYRNIMDVQDKINKLQYEVEKSKLMIVEWQNKCEELLKIRPLIDDCDDINVLLKRKSEIEIQLSETTKTIGGYQMEMKRDKDIYVQIEKERREAEVLFKETSRWKRLSDIFGSADGSRFKSIAQSYILLQLLENANHYLRQFTLRYELTTQSGSLIILIKDNEQSGILRPVNTLSGGESFMVSLALALGLSSLNRNRFTPDTLFIDEGFGTLSNDCLNTVIETLEILHTIGNRRVGIISHVNELYERITTRIEVKKHGNVSEIKTVG